MIIYSSGYIYDGLNQLKKEINDTTKEEITYTYDIDGNITKVAKDPNPEDPDSAITVTSYTYGNSAWKDQLTKYGSHTITYDEIGNPLSYRNSMSFTWKNGREMATANINGKNCSYYYNTDGIRTRKIAGTETTDYFVDDSGRIIGQESSTGRKILFMYDGSGAVVGMRYKSNASAQYVDYYYVKNAQGDITGIVDKDGVLKYTYETGMKVESEMSSIGNSSSPVSVYAKNRQDKWWLSSVGIIVNVFNFTLNYNLGLDDISLTGSIKNDGATSTLRIVTNLSRTKIGLHGSVSYTYNQITETAYSNVNVSGYVGAPVFNPAYS